MAFLWLNLGLTTPLGLLRGPALAVLVFAALACDAQATVTPTTSFWSEGSSSPEFSETATPNVTPAPEAEQLCFDNFWSTASVAEARSALDQGTDISVPDEEGMAPLHFAAACKRRERSG